MRIFKFVLRDNQWLLVGAILGGLCSGAGSAVIVSIISQRLTGVKPVNHTFLVTFAGLILLISVLNLLTRFLVDRATAWASIRMRLQLIRQILSAPLRQIEGIGTARLFATLNEDVITINSAVRTISTLAINLAIVLGALVYLTWLSPAAMGILLVLGIPATLGYQYLRKIVRSQIKVVYTLRNEQVVHFHALTEGIKELKIHNNRRRMFYEQTLRPVITAFLNKGRKVQLVQESASTWIQMVYFLFIFALFLLTAGNKVALPVLTSFALVVLYIRSSISNILSALPLWSTANGTLDTIEELGFSLQYEKEISESPVAPLGVPGHLELTLHQITHTYSRELDDNNFMLGPLDLTLRSGELVFLTGGNGSGKTTLVKVLAALYTPESGQIFLNGEQITAENQEAYRQNFSVLFSDYFLFEKLLGFEELDVDELAARYITRLQLEHKVKIQDGHLSTVNLSTGQRKRLALLVAYLEDRSVYVFDEWAAGQDPAFKDIFYRELLPALKNQGKLVLVVSHDDHYYDIADRIIKLDDGQIESDVLQQH